MQPNSPKLGPDHPNSGEFGYGRRTGRRVIIGIMFERKPSLQEAGRGGRRDKIVEGPVTWHLAALKLKPGDVIRYRAEALDWDDISGPHVGRSPELQIRILDPAE